MQKFTIYIIIALVHICFVSCSGDEPKNKVEDMTMTISSETGIMYVWGDSEYEHPIECMKVKYGNEDWQTLGFEAIENFEYVKGYEYNLKIQRTTLANPPADGSMYTYKLEEILSSKKVVVYPDVPVITDESQIEYEADSPDHFYDIWNNEIMVDNDGNMSHNHKDNSTIWLSYDKAIIYTTYVLPQTDSRWNKLKYMPTSAYVISPYTKEIYNVRISHGDIMLSNIVLPEDFEKIKSDVKAGESVSYYLILTNAWQKAIQKVELKIKKVYKIITVG